MRITLITACRNAGATVSDTLRSVAAQRWPDLQYLVLDGASTDDTLARVRAFADAHPGLPMEVHSSRDRNVYEAWNKGLAMADGEVIGFLNADDVFAADDVLHTVARAFREHRADCVYGDLDFVDRDQGRRVVRRWRSTPYRPGKARMGWHPPHPTLYVRRSVFERVGPFEPRFPMAGDVQWMVRLFEQPALRAHHVPAVLVRMRAGGISNGSLRKHVVANWQCFVAARAAGIPVSPLYIVRKPLSRVGQFLRRDWRAARRPADPPC